MDVTPTPEDAAATRRRLGRWLGAQRAFAPRPLRLAGLLGALAGCLVVPQAWLLAQAVAPVVTAGAGLAEVLPYLLPLPLLFLLRFALVQAADRAALQAATQIKAGVRDALVRRLQELGPAHVQGKASGALATTVIEGVDGLEPYYVRFVPHMLAVAVVPLVVLAAVLPRDWISGVVLLVTGPVIPLFMLLIGLGTEALNQRQWRRLARLGGRLLDGLQRLATLRMFNAAAREAQVLDAVSQEYRRATMAVLRVAFLSSLMLEFLATVGIALVAVLVGFRLLYGTMGFEAGFFALLLAPEFYAPLRQMGTDYHAKMEAMGAAEGIVAVLDAPVPPDGAGRPALPERIDIVCEGVDFAYEAGAPVLRGASLTLAAGQVTALVGPSGAGKSTLLALLLGLRRPEAGRILAGGHDLAQMARAHWLEHVALVPQRPHMFAGTVGDNIALGAPDAAPEAVRAAARMAGADGFITALPQGYDTPLGEHGHTLSGGQVQRIALARAFLKDAPVVLMDEATTGLDPETEAAITAAVARLARERTVLIIAHRLRTVRLADRIAVMEAGAIVEQGTHESLAAGRTRYAALLREAGLAGADRAGAGISQEAGSPGAWQGDALRSTAPEHMPQAVAPADSGRQVGAPPDGAPQGQGRDGMSQGVTPRSAVAPERMLQELAPPDDARQGAAARSALPQERIPQALASQEGGRQVDAPSDGALQGQGPDGVSQAAIRRSILPQEPMPQTVAPQEDAQQLGAPQTHAPEARQGAAPQSAAAPEPMPQADPPQDGTSLDGLSGPAAPGGGEGGRADG